MNNIVINFKESDGSIHLSESAPKVNVVYSVLQSILHPSFMKFRLVGFV